MNESISFAIVEQNPKDRSRFDIKGGRYDGTYFTVYRIDDANVTYWEFVNGARRVPENFQVGIDLAAGKINERLLEEIESSTPFVSYLSGS